MAAFANVAAEDFSLIPSTPFRTSASNGGAVGADVARVTAAVNGVAIATPGPGAGGTPSGTSGNESTAVCRTPLSCPAVDPFSHRR